MKKNRFVNLFSLLGILVLCALPACGGGGGGASSAGGSTGSTNTYSPLDLAGSWIGELTPYENSDLPWSNGEQRILSRNFFALADGEGAFQRLQDGTDRIWDTVDPEIESRTSNITGKGYFTVGFKRTIGDRAELVLVGRMNKARNLVNGEYELRMHTQPGQLNQSEAVDAGTFEMTLSSGADHFTDNMFEGDWEGQNYRFDESPSYLKCRLSLNQFGDVTGGGMFDSNDTQLRLFKTDGANDGLFPGFDDSSVGRFDGTILEYQGGRVLEILFLIMDENGSLMTGPAIGIDGKISYLRFRRKS
jgi:hypothetical protein